MSDAPSGRLMQFLKHPFVLMIMLGLGIRFVLMPLLTFTTDMSYWIRISNIADSGYGLYQVEGYYYTPVWGCIMSVVTALCSLIGINTYGVLVPELLQYQNADFSVSAIVPTMGYSMMVKLPLVIVDVAVAYCLYALVKDITDDQRKALLASALWFLCPLVIEESCIHGMFDNMSALLILLCVMMVRKGGYFWAGAAFGTAVLTKFFPIFFMFFLIAWVLRREGLDRNGGIAVGKALIGAVAAFVVIEIPAVMDGMFWESLFFLTDRIGLSTETMKSIFTVKGTLIIVAVLAVIVLALYLFNRRFDGGFLQHVVDMDPVRRDGIVKKSLLAILVLAVVGVVGYSVLTVGGSTAFDIFQSVGMKFVTLLSIVSLLIEMYLAYRLLFYGGTDDRRVFKIALLSAMAIFLWPPAPQYIMVVLPFIAVYCTVCSDRMVKPFVAFTVLMTAFQCVLGGVSCIFPLVVETGIMQMSSLLPILDFFTSYVGPIPTIGILMAIVGGAAYLSMLNISYRAIKEEAYV